MPTKPLEALFDRDHTLRQTAPIREPISKVLRELVNAGTNVFRRCDATTQFEGDVALGPLTLFYHCLEMADGIEVLLAECCVTPAKPLLRSVFEGRLSLQFIAQSDTEQRARQWYVWHINDRLRRIAQYGDDGSTMENFRRHNSDWTPAELEKLAAAVEASKEEAKGLRKILKDPRIADIVAEYERDPKRHRKHFAAMFGGSASVEELVRVVDDSLHYDVFYRQWSGITHGSDLRRVYGEHEGAAAWYALRNPTELVHVGQMASSLFLECIRSVLAIFRPDEQLATWYLREVKPLLDYIKSIVVSVE